MISFKSVIHNVKLGTCLPVTIPRLADSDEIVRPNPNVLNSMIVVVLMERIKDQIINLRKYKLVKKK